MQRAETLPTAAARSPELALGLRLELSAIAHGVARLTLAELAAMRKAPPRSFPPQFSPQFLKHSDEQTLAALAALYAAIGDCGLAGRDFDRWGVVSLSRYMGRGAAAGVFDKYRIDGAWGVSVQIIPHRSPHAIAGTISLGLGTHGPCIGVNGGPDGDRTALLSLPALLAGQAGAAPNCEGVWFVVTDWSPELAIDVAGKPISDSTCRAAALALVPHDGGKESLGAVRFEWNCEPADRPAQRRPNVVPPPHIPRRLANEPTAANLFEFLTDQTPVATAGLSSSGSLARGVHCWTSQQWRPTNQPGRAASPSSRIEIHFPAARQSP